MWIDPPICERATAVIPGLLRRINTMEAERNKEMRKRWRREKFIWAWAFVSIIIILCKSNEYVYFVRNTLM